MLNFMFEIISIIQKKKNKYLFIQRMLNSATYSLSPDLRYVMVVHDAKRVFRQTSSSSYIE